MLRVEMGEWDGYISSVLLRVEAVRACARYGGAYAKDAREWLFDVSLLSLDDAILDDATRIEPTGLRSLDAIHLATALSIRDDVGVFFTYDERLGAAAGERGLPVAAPA